MLDAVPGIAQRGCQVRAPLHCPVLTTMPEVGRGDVHDLAA